jgi:hypothetical protein
LSSLVKDSYIFAGWSSWSGQSSISTSLSRARTWRIVLSESMALLPLIIALLLAVGPLVLEDFAPNLRL